MTLFAELQRRNVIRVAILYVVGSWLVLQIGDLLFDLMGLPDFALRIVLGILILGLPIALVGSWVYEVTPEGIKRESEIDRSASITSRTGQKLNIAVIIAILLGIGTVLADRFLLAPSTADDVSAETSEATSTSIVEPPEADTAPADGAINAIAVLPFNDFSQAKDQSYLAEGIADTILHALAQVDGLKVAARTSSFRLAELGADIATVGDRLKVGAVLEGSVQKAGDQLRIIAQLVQVSDESQLWSEAFDRPEGDIFAIQDEIALAVIEALGQDAGSGGVGSGAAQRTSPEIYERYLKGRSLWQQRTVESTQEAVRVLREVVARDPDFAPGHSELAQAIFINASYEGRGNEAVLELVSQLAERALELDSEDSAAYRILATLAGMRDEELDSQLELYRKSLALNPNDPTTHAYLARSLSSGARWDEAEVHFREAVALDPLNIYARGQLAHFLAAFGDDPEGALAVVRETIALAPDEIQTWSAAASVFSRVGRLADSARAGLKRVELDPASPAGPRAVAETLAKLGDIDTAERWMALAAQLESSIAVPCDWYLMSDLPKALACSETRIQDGEASLGEIYDYARTLWVSGRDADAFEGFEQYLARTSEDRERGLARYGDLVALIARLRLKPAVDRPVTDEDRSAPRALRGLIVGQSTNVDQISSVHVLVAEGRIEEAAAILENSTVDYLYFRTMMTLPLFEDFREHPSVKAKLETYRNRLRSEHAALVADGPPGILDPPETIEELQAGDAER